MAKADQIISDPTNTSTVTKAAPDALDALSKKLGHDNERIAEALGIEAKDVPGIRTRFDQLAELQGYQAYANCYTYAMNDIDGIKSPDKNLHGDDPGRRALRSGDLSSEIADKNQDYESYKKALLDDVISDGSQRGGMDAKPKEGHYRVAVYSKPPENVPQGDRDNGAFTDMHFVRENKDGTWSHKPGREAVTDKDVDGKPIIDPKTANVGGYDFLGYVYVPEGGLDVGRPGEPSTKPGSIQLDQQRNAAPPVPVSSFSAFPDLNMIASRMPTSPETETPAVAKPQPTPVKVAAFSP